MKNTIRDLNNHLFAELERLGDEELEGEGLKDEIRRATAIAAVSSQVIQLGNLVVKAAKAEHETGENSLEALTGESNAYKKISTRRY